MNTAVFVVLLAITTTLCLANPLAGNTCGGISSVTRWERTARDDSIRMNIDTTRCSFQNTPLYFTSITGGVGHYLLTGINAIYEPTRTGFTINVRSIDGATSDTLMQRSAQWTVNWFGVSI